MMLNGGFHKWPPLNDLPVIHILVPLRFHPAVATRRDLGLKRIWTQVPQCGVEPLAIIRHFHIVDDESCDGFRSLFPNRLIQPFVFDAPKDAFHHGIVPTIAPPTHAADHLMLLEQGLIDGTGILTAAIRVMQKAWRGLPQWPWSTPSPRARSLSWIPLPSPRSSGKTDPPPRRDTATPPESANR